MDATPNKRLDTVAEVIEALGGSNAVRRLTGVKSTQAVWNWGDRASFPSDLYVLMTEALAAKGFVATPTLWQMREEVHDGH